MATEKVGVYRKYHGPVPTDKHGRLLPKEEWPEKRPFRWAVRWFGSDGKRYSKSFESRKEAQRFAESKQSDVRSGKADKPPTITLNNFIAEHERIMKGQVEPATLYDQMRVLKMFAVHIDRDLRLVDISPREAEMFVSVRLASDVKIPTVNKDIRTLKRVFNIAIEPRGYLASGQNPFAKIKQRKVTPKPVRYIGPEQLRSLLASTGSTWWKALIVLAYTSGGRRDELLNMTWADVDFDRQAVRFSPKAGSSLLLAWEPKDHEERVVPIPPEVVQLLADLQNEAVEKRPYVFVPEHRMAGILSRRDKGTWRPSIDLVNNIIRDLKGLCRRAGIEIFTLHDLRRSCITNWAQVLPMHVVQKLAGHSDIKTTQRYYLAVQEHDLEEARKIQSHILRADPTDPKLTHFGLKSTF